MYVHPEVEVQPPSDIVRTSLVGEQVNEILCLRVQMIIPPLRPLGATNQSSLRELGIGLVIKEYVHLF